MESKFEKKIIPSGASEIVYFALVAKIYQSIKEDDFKGKQNDVLDSLAQIFSKKVGLLGRISNVPEAVFGSFHRRDFLSRIAEFEFERS